jgi:hypothetical protein
MGGKALMLALGLTLCLWPNPGEAFDKRDFCLAKAPNTLIFLDTTTPYDSQDRKSLSDGILKIVDRLSGGERITLRTINDSFSHSEILFSDCYPKCKYKSWMDQWLSDCTTGIELVERQKFRTQLIERISASAGHFDEKSQSDILSTIYFIAPAHITAQKERFPEVAWERGPPSISAVQASPCGRSSTPTPPSNAKLVWMKVHKNGAIRPFVDPVTRASACSRG